MQDVLIVHASLTGTARKLATKAGEILNVEFPEIGKAKVLSASDIDPEDLPSYSIALFIISTHSGAKPPKTGQFFLSWLQEAALDFRVGRNFLKG